MSSTGTKYRNRIGREYQMKLGFWILALYQPLSFVTGFLSDRAMTLCIALETIDWISLCSNPILIYFGQ